MQFTTQLELFIAWLLLASVVGSSTFMLFCGYKDRYNWQQYSPENEPGGSQAIDPGTTPRSDSRQTDLRQPVGSNGLR